MPGVELAWRQARTDWRAVLRLSWVALTLSFLLLTVQTIMPALFKGFAGHVLHFFDQAFWAVAYVGLLRHFILGENPAAGRKWYFNTGRREAIYAGWTISLTLLFVLIEKIAPDPETLDFAPGFLIEHGIPLARDIFMSILLLTWPHIAVAENPKLPDMNALNKAVAGNVTEILVTVCLIFLPYVLVGIAYNFTLDWVKAGDPGFYRVWTVAWRYGLHALYCVCAIAQVSYMAIAYRLLWLGQPPASMPR